MGGLFSKLASFFRKRPLDVVVMGLENAGKTTLTRVLAHGDVMQTVPTVGLSIEEASVGKLKMRVFDLAGQQKFRSRWSTYSQSADCLIFVVDAYDVERVPEARRELHQLLENPDLSDIPLLIVLNKTDLEPHLVPEEAVQLLNMEYITQQRWAVASISALRQENIEKVIEWLTIQPRRKKSTSSKANTLSS